MILYNRIALRLRDKGEQVSVPRKVLVVVTVIQNSQYRSGNDYSTGLIIVSSGLSCDVHYVRSGVGGGSAKQNEKYSGN